jgi:tetratricopeptide (TPR) repeat protein
MRHSKSILITYYLVFILLLLAPPYAHASQEFYTVQISSFITLEDARKYYDSVINKLREENLDHFRIEKIGDYFSVRIGKFEDRLRAENYFHSIKHHFPLSIMRKAYIKEARIKLLYSRKQPVKQHTVRAKPTVDSVPDISRSWVSINPDKSEISAAGHEKSGNMLLKAGDYFRAAEEFRIAIDKGLKHPVTYWKLSESLYEIKFVDEAIIALEKAVALSKMNDVLKIELAKLYLVKDRLEDARKQLTSTLRINPCSAGLHYYLGEVFLRMKEYDKAWYSATAAKGLGHTSENLTRKLAILSQEPESYPWDNENAFSIRQILVEDFETAGRILKLIADGELFENIADAESMIPGKPIGGYMGRYNKSDLHPKISIALHSQKVFAEPVIVETDSGFHIVQRVANFDVYLEDQLLAGSDERTGE